MKVSKYITMKLETRFNTSGDEGWVMLTSHNIGNPKTEKVEWELNLGAGRIAGARIGVELSALPDLAAAILEVHKEATKLKDISL